MGILVIQWVFFTVNSIMYYDFPCEIKTAHLCGPWKKFFKLPSFLGGFWSHVWVKRSEILISFHVLHEGLNPNSGGNLYNFSFWFHGKVLFFKIKYSKLLTWIDFHWMNYKRCKKGARQIWIPVWKGWNWKRAAMETKRALKGRGDGERLKIEWRWSVRIFVSTLLNY